MWTLEGVFGHSRGRSMEERSQTPATEADPRRSGKGATWEEELAKAEESCQRLDMRYRLLRVKNQAGVGIGSPPQKPLLNGVILLFLIQHTDEPSTLYVDVLDGGRP